MAFLDQSSTFKSMIEHILGIINMLILLLGTLALIIFFIGLVRYIYEAADAKGHKEGRERIVWSLVAIFVLFSLWGIINLLEYAFLGTSSNTNYYGTVT